MERIFVRPNDTLIFGGSKPFNKTPQNNIAEFGEITPRPFFGMLRTVLLLSLCNSKKNVSISELDSIRSNYFPNELEEFKSLLKDIGHPYVSDDGIPNMGIKGIFLCNEIGEELFPIPRDLLKVIDLKGDEEKVSFDRSKPKENLSKQLILDYNNDLKFSQNSAQNLFFGNSVKNSELIEDAFYITKNAFKHYLSDNVGEIKKSDLISAQELPYKSEWRIGIQIDPDSQTAQEHFLYRTEQIRFKEDFDHTSGFILWYDDAKIKKYMNQTISKSEQNRTLYTGKLGGENKTVFLKTIEKLDISEEFNYPGILKKIEKTKRFFIYLATPSIFFNNGNIDWKPNLKDIATITGLKEDSLKFLGGLLSKPLLIGGFDTVRKKPLDLKRYVPAGSVYFYEFSDGTIDQSAKWPVNISNYKQKEKEGFGLLFIGGY